MEKENLNTSSDSYYEDDEITLKELILKFREYYKEIVQNKVKVFTVALSFALLFLLFSVYKFWKQTPTYTTKVDFVGKVEGLLTTKGYTKSYIKYGDISNFELREQSFEKTMFDKIEIDGEKDFLANHFIKIYNLNTVEDFYFTKDNIAEFTLSEKRVLGKIKILVFGMKLGLTSQQDEDSRVVDTMLVLQSSRNGRGRNYPLLQIAVTTRNGELSAGLMNNFYNKLTQNYIQEIEDTNESMLKHLQERKDSIYLDLLDSEGGFQNLSNSLQEEKYNILNQLLRSQTPISPLEVISKDLELEFNRSSSKYVKLYKLYEGIIKSIEELEFKAQNQKISFSQINQTYEPIKNAISFKDTIKNSGFIKGFVIGFFLIIVYLIGQKIVSEAIAE